MIHRIIYEDPIDILLYFFQMFFMSVGTYYMFLKLINKKVSISNNIIITFSMILINIVCSVLRGFTNLFTATIVLLTLLVIVFRKLIKCNLGYTIITAIVALCISYVAFFIPSAFYSLLIEIVFYIRNDYFTFLFTGVSYGVILYMVSKIKKLRNGFSFLNKEAQSEFFDVLILNISVIILFSIILFGNAYISLAMKIAPYIAIFVVVMFITVRKSFQVYYKQKLLMKEVEETKEKLANKEKEVEKLEQENLSFSKKSHSLAHKQKVLEHKINKLMLNTEISDEIDIKDKVEQLSKELYDNDTKIELTKTGIEEIDDMFSYMQEECIKNKIDLNLQINGNIYYMINNIVSKEELEILIADHIKDAMIAINHSDNINKSILVKLGQIDDCYGLYIYDSGIEFEKETLENLGKKPITTHKDEGGTGMGFMNTFDTLKRHQGSLIIKEIGEPSKENYTKIIMIKFDNRNEYKVESYKSK